MVEFRDTLPGDSWLIVDRVRACEREELTALGLTAEVCIRYGLQFGFTQTAFMNGKPAAIVGIVNYGDVQVPWAVFTDLIDAHPIAFLRASKRWLAVFEGPLVNHVDARNTLALKWFAWLGFEILPPVPRGLRGELFHEVRHP